MLYFLIIIGILFELIIIIGGVYLILKFFKKQQLLDDRKIEVKVSGKSITAEAVRDGVKEAIREIAFEDEQQKQIEKKNKAVEYVYSSIPTDKPVKRSGGNLVPYNLTESEKTALEMFYE